MYIDERDRGVIVIQAVNWLHYLNYEAIYRSSGACHQFIWGESYGQTVTYYIWFESLTHAAPVVRLYEQCHTVRPSHTLDVVTAFHVPSPSFGLRCSWEIFVSVRTYGINTNAEMNFIFNSEWPGAIFLKVWSKQILLLVLFDVLN